MLKLYTIGGGGIIMIVMIVSAKVIYQMSGNLDNLCFTRLAVSQSGCLCCYVVAYAFVPSGAELQAPAGSSILADMARDSAPGTSSMALAGARYA